MTTIPARRSPLTTAALARADAEDSLLTTGEQMRELEAARLPIPAQLAQRYAGLLAAYDEATAEVRRLTRAGAA